MNKKFYLVALVCAVAGTSVISSCKDTDEDLYTELRNELAFNAGQYDKLSKALDDLAGKIHAMKDGEDGKDGKDGKDGNDGKSAYDLAVENGFEGDVNAWLESLKGKDGSDATCECAIKTAQDVWDVLKDRKVLTEKEYEELLKMIADASKSLDIAGINIENVYNPAFGYLNLPLGIQSNILTAYYSTVAKSEFFPAVEEAVEKGLTEKELKLIDFPVQRFDLTENEIKVGKVYVSVNPADVNFSGKTPLLVNSKGEESGITLSPLEVCDETLSWGYTRAAASTGFYVSEAVVTDLGATEKVNFNLEETAKKFKDAMKESGATNSSKIVRAAYEMLNNVCQRKALKLTNKENTVVSGLNLAAALVQPLGFKTLKQVSESDYMQELIDATAPTTGKKPVDRVLAEAQKTLKNLYAYSMPAVIAEEENGDACLMSVKASAPTVVGSNIKLHAVSYSGEILVPYVMKHLAVVDGPSVEAIKQLNNAVHMNCIINHCDFKDFVIELAGVQPGTYTLVYSVMDYEGQAKAQRLYFTVK